MKNQKNGEKDAYFAHLCQLGLWSMITEFVELNNYKTDDYQLLARYLEQCEEKNLSNVLPVVEADFLDQVDTHPRAVVRYLAYHEKKLSKQWTADHYDKITQALREVCQKQDDVCAATVIGLVKWTNYQFKDAFLRQKCSAICKDETYFLPLV